MRKKRTYEDDDGRTVADMSGVDRQPLLSARRAPKQPAENGEAEARQEDRPGEQQALTGKERKAYLFGALAAALLIGAVFMVGIGLAILLMVLIWR